MTNEEAIKALSFNTNIGYGVVIEIQDWYAIGTREIEEALDMAIKALETLEEFEKAQIITGGRLNGRTYAYKCGLEDGKRKALEQEPCEDCISREYILSKAHCCRDDLADDEPCCVDVDDIKEAPSVQPKPKTGHWIAEDIHNCHTDFKCSECGYIHNFVHLYGKPTADYTYCPNCGAKMESEDKE